jgi:hypothetical protein
MPAIKKGNVTENINPKVLKILSKAYGREISFVDDLTYDEYYNDLREAVVIGKNLSDSEKATLLNERKRVSGAQEEHKKFFAKKTKMTAADIKRGSSIQLAENSALSLYNGRVGKSPEGESDDNLGDIDEKLDEILETLREEGEFDEDQAEAERIKAEKAKRIKKEKNLERWKALKTTATKVVKPFRSLWDKIWGFLKTILLGNILTKIIGWMGDKKNQDKIKNIFRFLKDWWPTLLAAYVLFGNSLGRFVVGFLAKVGVWVAKSIPMMIKALAAALARLKAMKWLKLLGGRRGMRALQLTSAVGGMGMIMTGNTPSGREEDNQGGISSVTPRDEDYVHYGPESGVGAGFSQKEENQKMNKMMEEKNFNNGGLVQQFAQGGVVRGPGGVDKVPARLTAGEFVMSKGAVQKYGVNTMKAMNAAGGGTNVPSMYYNQGGPVHNTQFYSDGGRVNLPSFKFYKQPDQFYKRPNISQNFAGGGLVTNLNITSKPTSELRVGEANAETLRLAEQERMSVPGPPIQSKSVVQRYNVQQQQSQQTSQSTTKGSTVPDFDPEKYISKQKIETLGMTL